MSHPICCKWRRFRAESTRSVTMVRERPTYSMRLDIVERFTTSKQFPRVACRWWHDQGRITIAHDATLENCVRFLAIGWPTGNCEFPATTYVHYIRVSDETEVGAGSQNFYFFAYVNKLIIDVRWRLFSSRKIINRSRETRPDF